MLTICTIKKNAVPQWGYDVIIKGIHYHNVATTAEKAIHYAKNRFGAGTRCRISK